MAILIRPKGQDAYMWAHDKLQTVAYSLIPPVQRPKFHLRLGRLLWNMSQRYPDEEWMVFMAAEQMNRYSELQNASQKEQEQPDEVLGAEVATLCLEAARLSLAKSALYPAYDMLQAGVKHLNVPDKWKNHYELCLKLYSTVAELSIQLDKGRHKVLSAICKVETNAQSLEDNFRVQMVYLKHITSGTDRNYERGMETAMEILKTYAVRLPNKLLPGAMMLECNKLRRRLPGGKLEGFLELPTMTDTMSRNIMKLLSFCGIFTMMSTKSNKSLGWFTAVRGLNLSTEKGVTEETAMAIVTLGSALRAQGNLKDANEYGELGLKLLGRFPETVGSLHAAVMSAAIGGVFTSTKPLNNVLDLWLEAHHVGLRTGKTEKAAGSILSYALTYITCGLPLDPLMSDLKEFEKEVIQFNLPGTILAVFKILQQFILNLREPPGRNPTLLKGDVMHPDKLLSTFSGNAYIMTKRDMDTFSLLLALIYGESGEAERLIGKLEPFLENDFFYVRSSMRRSVVALAAFKISRNNGKRKLRMLARKIMKEYREKLKNGNVNALPIYTMLEAEESPSKARYDHAIRLCARLGLIHFEAYMCEQAGLFFLEQKDEDWAEFYLAQAFCLCEDWGARGKAQRLKEEHPQLLRSSLRERANTALKGRTRYSSTHTDLLKDFDWERLSTSVSRTSSTHSLGLMKSSSSDSNLAGMAKLHGGGSSTLGGDDTGDDATLSVSDDTRSEMGSSISGHSRRRTSENGSTTSGPVMGNFDFSSPLY